LIQKQLTKTFVLLRDAYRELNARRLFWTALIISGIVVGLFGAVAIQGDVVTVFGWESPLRLLFLAVISKATFYKLLFVNLGIEYWLALFATFLALVSTAGIFPDFLAIGSIELYLSKPVTRLQLFIIKYVGGLLFVTLQVTVFCAASFVVMGLRGHSWEPSLFLAVPLVVLMFSYLYSVCVFFGVLTRSTIAALMLTLIFWGLLWIFHQSEIGLLRAHIFDQRHAARLDQQIADAQNELNHPSTQTATAPSTAPANASWWQRWLSSPPAQTQIQARVRIAQMQGERAGISDHFEFAHRIAYAVVTPLPKISETIGLIERELIDRAALPPILTDDVSEARGRPAFRARGRENAAVTAEIDEILRDRPLSWVLGTSCIFEAVVLAAAAWIFCRRDY
jgi:hypothetical protein